MKDKAWVARWNAGDVEARKEMSNLDAIIHAAWVARWIAGDVEARKEMSNLDA